MKNEENISSPKLYHNSTLESKDNEFTEMSERDSKNVRLLKMITDLKQESNK
jgi:hypothetical protein